MRGSTLLGLLERWDYEMSVEAEFNIHGRQREPDYDGSNNL